MSGRGPRVTDPTRHLEMQIIFVLLQLIILPSISFALCPVPTISKVTVSNGVVRWQGVYNTSCIEGFEMCWYLTSGSKDVLTCKMAPATADSVTVEGLEPCHQLTAEVTVIGRGANENSTKTAQGNTGLPVVPEFKILNINRNFLKLKWTNMYTSPCSDFLQLKICDDEANDTSACHTKKIDDSFNTIVLKDYNILLCRDYTVSISTGNSFGTSAETSLKFFIKSDNSIAEITQTNVTHDSVVLNYSVTINTQCPRDKLKICYRGYDGSLESNCQNLTLNTNSFSDFVKLTDLKSCTKYSAYVSIGTDDKTASYNSVSFITRRGDQPVLKTVTANWSYPFIVVKWTMANNFGWCGSLFNVTWTSNLTNETNFKTLSDYQRAARIYNDREDLTFVIHVAAVFPDGDSEFLSTTVETNRPAFDTYNPFGV